MIARAKLWRPKRQSKRQDDTCRSKSCDYCRGNRTFKSRRMHAGADSQLREHLYYENDDDLLLDIES